MWRAALARALSAASFRPQTPTCFTRALTGFQGAAVRLRNRLFRVQVSESRCASFLHDKSVHLPGEFPNSASELRLEFTVWWPILRLGRPRTVRTRLLSTAGRPFLEEDEWRLTQKHRWWTTEVHLTLPALPAVEEGCFRLEILRERPETLLGTLDFHLLDPLHAKNLVLEGLRAENQQLWIYSSSQRYRSDHVAFSSDFVIPEFTILGPPLAAFLHPLESVLTLSLVAGTRPQLLSQSPISIGERPLSITGPAIPVRGTALATPGGYCIRASIDNHEVAAFHFQIVGERELLQQVKVAHTHVLAEPRNEPAARPVRVLRWQEHKAFQVSLELETTLLAPNTTFQCSALVLQDGALRYSQEFLLTLDRPSLQLVLERLRLADLACPGRLSRLSILVRISQEQKAILNLSIRPTQPLTNFEGRLNLDPKHLQFEDAEYSQILKDLGVSDLPPPRRGLWRRRSGA